MIIYLVENVSQKPRNSLMRGRVRGMLRYQVPRLFRCKFRKKMQEKQEECEIIILRTQKLSYSFAHNVSALLCAHFLDNFSSYFLDLSIIGPFVHTSLRRIGDISWNQPKFTVTVYAGAKVLIFSKSQLNEHFLH